MSQTSSAAHDASQARSDDRPIVFLSQVYVPDPAAVGQQLHDAAQELVARGRRVIVYTSSAGYDDPRVRYPLLETRDGVEIRRLRWTSFGKGSLTLRMLAGVSFVAQCIVRCLLARRPGGVVVSTSPPLCPLAA
ncbi:MAG: hypothetical protein KDA41_07925, partial [Planctomycetales bacterium]|nr:hypothetical protein [Planctomycetales bacterium]